MTTPAPDQVAGLTARLARFAAQLHFEDLPDLVVTRLSQCLLDFIGVAAAGSIQAESSSAVLDGVQNMSPPDGPATAIGLSRGYPAQYAALLNGTFAHSLDFDDTNIPSALHPGAPVIPSALAVAEQTDAGGRDFLTAVAAGYEVCCRVGLALGTTVYDRGFHPTAIAGLFGAVAAGAQLLDLSAEQLDSAFGLAGSMASGSMQYLENGSWNKRLHPGLAAHNALLALSFTAAGFHGATKALEGRHGVLSAYSLQPQPELLDARLGEHWVLAETGIKPYPACRLAHGAIDAALQLRKLVGGTIPATAHLTVRISPTAYSIVGGDDPHKTAPTSTVDGQFSAYFQTAVALLDGAVDWSSYARLDSADVRDLIGRLEVVADEHVHNAGADLTLRLDDGQTRHTRVDEPAGEPGADLPWEPVEAKYRGNVRSIYTDEQAGRIVQQVRTLTNGGRVRPLAQLLRA